MYYMGNSNGSDKGGQPFVENIKKVAMQNNDFRRAIWVGDHLQMTVMEIPPQGEIGLEMHDTADQFIRVENGTVLIRTGDSQEDMDMEYIMSEGMGAFIPAGTWHNVMNTGRTPVKVSSLYAPPNHPKGTVQRTKEEAEVVEKAY